MLFGRRDAEELWRRRPYRLLGGMVVIVRPACDFVYMYSPTPLRVLDPILSNAAASTIGRSAAASCSIATAFQRALRRSQVSVRGHSRMRRIRWRAMRRISWRAMRVAARCSRERYRSSWSRSSGYSVLHWRAAVSRRCMRMRMRMRMHSRCRVRRRVRRPHVACTALL